MIVIPAVDLRDGKCVRLIQGKFDQMTVFSEAPEEMALHWQKKGAELIHVVDLDGAVHKSPQNVQAIRAILSSVNVPVQLGGGIRDMETIDFYLDMGVSRLILGTAAQQKPEFLIEACSRFPGAIVASVDARHGRVAIDGWTRDTLVSPFELATKLEKGGVAAIIYTDISRDGMRTGPNLDHTRVMCRTVSVPVICAGGVSTINDIKQLLGIREPNLWGVITGRAIYEGTLDFVEAVELARHHMSAGTQFGRPGNVQRAGEMPEIKSCMGTKNLDKTEKWDNMD